MRQRRNLMEVHPTLDTPQYGVGFIEREVIPDAITQIHQNLIQVSLPIAVNDLPRLENRAMVKKVAELNS